MKSEDCSNDRSIDQYKSYYVMLRYSLSSISDLLSLSCSQAYLDFLGQTTGSGCIFSYIYRKFSVQDNVRKYTPPYGTWPYLLDSRHWPNLNWLSRSNYFTLQRLQAVKLCKRQHHRKKDLKVISSISMDGSWEWLKK